ncbi:MAG: TIGR04282 family arsenosugar biosynthesis glycosyltransferase, partial [Verrucomicrobiota bacterium]
GDLGDRMLGALNHAFELGYGEAVIIGTDCPALSARHLKQAFDTLKTNDVVLGPTFDGGYYLIGMKQPHQALFRDIPWSTEAVFPNTMEVMKTENLSCGLLPRLRDLDDQDDLGFYELKGVSFAV